MGLGKGSPWGDRALLRIKTAPQQSVLDWWPIFGWVPRFLVLIGLVLCTFKCVCVCVRVFERDTLALCWDFGVCGQRSNIMSSVLQITQDVLLRWCQCKFDSKCLVFSNVYRIRFGFFLWKLSIFILELFVNSWLKMYFICFYWDGMEQKKCLVF